MASKDGSSYPSPTAAQTGNGSGPYPGRHAETQPEDLELSVHLRQEINPSVDHNAGQGARQDQHFQQIYSQQAYPQMTMQQSPLGPPQAPPVTVPTAPGHNPSVGDEASAKKKSKASRACDECRRKKIKCDADSDNPNAPACSNCRRTNSENCRFSRTPMKRGPSKGYIKELSDRVANLEQERQKSGLPPSQASPTGSGDLSFIERKRTHSMSEGFSEQPYSTPIQSTAGGPWSSNYSFATSSSTPFANMAFSSTAPVTTSPGQDSVALAADEITNLDQYYAKIHPTLPLLPLGHEIHNLMMVCSIVLRNAFFEAVSASSSPLTGGARVEKCKSTFQSLQNNVGSNVAHRSFLANLVYLQTLILLIIAMESNGHISVQPSDAPSKGAMMAIAKDVIGYLKIRDTGADIQMFPEAEPWQVSIRRTWHIFMILENWDAIGNARRPMTDRIESEHPPSSDLGTNLLYFTRLCHATWPFGDATGGLIGTDPVHSVYLAGTLNAVVNTVRDMIPDSQESSLAFVASWHLKVLAARLELSGKVVAPPDRLMNAASKVASLLPTIPPFPLSYHFLILTAKTLIEAADFQATRAEAINGLKWLAQMLEGNPTWQRTAWDGPVAKAIEAKLKALGAGDSLQHLADAAIGDDKAEGLEDVAGAAGEEGKAWGTLILEGYLGAFA